MNPILTAKELQHFYTIGKTRLEVLKGISLDIDEGETLSIMGESGSGKSTLLHVLGGLGHSGAGAVHFRGENFYRLSSVRRARFRAENIGFIFQSFHLLSELDIMENVMLPAMASRLKSGAEVRARKLLTEVGLAGRIGHRPQELSGGEQQRAAIVRALMNEPDIVFADEPTGNLDAGTGKKVLQYLFHLVEMKRHALVLVTHSREVALRCSRTLFLKNGLLIDEKEAG